MLPTVLVVAGSLGAAPTYANPEGATVVAGSAIIIETTPSGARDPGHAAIVDRKGLERSAASTSQMGRYETAWLATGENLAALTELSGVGIDRVHERKPPRMIILDMDTSEGPIDGE